MKTPTKQQIKDTAALKQKKFREETGKLLVEGRHPIEEALKAGLTLQEIYLLADQPGGWPALELPVEPYGVSAADMDRMATTDSPPPCLAVFTRPPAPRALRGDFVLVLDGVQDPGNLGTLVRSAMAFGVNAIVLAGGSVEPFNPKVIRGSAGLIFALPVLNVPETNVSALLAGDDWKLYTTTGEPAARSYREADYSGRCAIVLGNEGRGVSPDLLAGRSVTALTIPMSPAVESLNVAVSGSIILAEAAARRGALQASGRRV